MPKNTYSEIRDDLKWVADALTKEGIEYMAYNYGVQYNARDANGVVQSFYPTTGTILFHATNNRGDHRTERKNDKTIDDFISYLKNPETIKALFKETRKMKRFSDYNETKSYTESEKLPVGGYVVKIQNVRYEEGQNGYSDRLILMVDVSEGEYKDFYKKQYEGQIGEDKKWKGTYTIYVPKDDGSERDGWTKRKFKTIMEHIEASNPGYSWNWDENTLKGKFFGAIVGEINTTIEGRDITYNAIRLTNTVDNIRKGAFRIPDPLDKTDSSPKKETKTVTGSEDFISVDGTQEEIPF